MTVTSAAGSPRVTVVRPTSGWSSSIGMAELWSYRDLLYFYIWRDVKSRFRQTMLGPIWFVLAPLVRMVVFTVVFGRIARLPSEGVPYALFTYTALLPWELFAGAVRGATGSLVNNLHVMSKVYFPRLILPLSAAASGLVDFAFSLVILLAMSIYYGYGPSWRLLAVPAMVVLALTVALGVGLWLATLAVRYRDVAHFVGYGLQLWLYATPIAYSTGLVPDRWQALYRLNPMFWVVEGFRWSVWGGGSRPGGQAALTMVVAALFVAAGAVVFRRTERTIVDVL